MAMTNPYVITISIVNGDPRGITVVERSGWVGQGICFPRNQLREAEEFGLDSPGVYFLLGETDDALLGPRIYIGEAEKISDRLHTHQSDNARDFWTRTVAFISKDQSLNKADVKFIESTLIGRARSIGAWQIDNANNSILPSLAKSDQIKVQSYIDTMLPVLPVLGIFAFEPATTRGLLKYYLSSQNAKGVGEDQSGGFLVLEGAQIQKQETLSLSERIRRLRSNLFAEGLLVDNDDYLLLRSDYLFSSPSTAASVLLGRSANGRIEWRDEKGHTLKQNQEI